MNFYRYTVYASKNQYFVRTDTPLQLYLIVPLFTSSHQTKNHVFQTKILPFRAQYKRRTFSHLTVDFQHDKVVLWAAPHSADQVARQQPWPEPHQECLVMDEAAAQKHCLTNTEAWKREIMKLWVTRMSDNSYCTWRTWWSSCPGGCRRWLWETGPPPSIDILLNISEIKILL